MRRGYLRMVSALLLFAGCATKPLPPVDATPLVTAHTEKDRVVVDWSAKIDVLVDQWLALFPAPQGVQIKTATAAQRAAVAAAPAIQFNVVSDAYKQQVTKLEKRIGELQDAERKKQVAFLRWFGLAMIPATGALVYFGQRGLAGLTLFCGVLALGLAQLISQPWFELAFNLSLGLVALIALAAAIYDWAQKRKADRVKQAHDNVIKGVEDVRGYLKNPSEELIEAVRSAASTEAAMLAVQKISHGVSTRLQENVAGAAAIIDQRRRELNLIP